MMFGTIVFLLVMCVSIQYVFGSSGQHGECRRKNIMLHNKISWLYGINRNLLYKMRERKDCKYKSITYASCETFEDGCNACVCNNGIVACTKRTCNQDCSHISVTYADGETFEDDCNACVCNNGIVACTNNTCNQGCQYDGTNHLHGDSFTSRDGCYNCTCEHGCLECETRICADVGQLGPFGATSRSAPTANDVPGGYVNPNSANPPWEAVDGDDTTHARAISTLDTRAWWMLEFQCLETISAVVLTSSTAGDPDEEFKNLDITVDGLLCGTVGDSPGGGMTVTVTCEEPLTGRSLKILKDEDGNSVMRIAEVVPILEALPGGEICELVPLQ